MNEGDTDIPMTRILDGRATPADWRAFERAAEGRPGAWKELALLQHDDRALRASVAEAVDRAEAVDAPVHGLAGGHPESWRMSARARTVATWAGWAVAASVAVAFVTARPQQPRRGYEAASTAGVPAPDLTSASDFLSNYLSRGKQEGTVIREVPERWVVSTEPTETGGQRVLYLRLILEQATVQDFYKYSQDEWGNPTPVKVQVEPPRSVGPTGSARVRPPV